MVEVFTDEVALDDERRIRAIVKRLGLPHLSASWLKTVGFGRSLDEFSYWERYLLNKRTTFKWHNKADVWLTPDERAGVLRRVVITGLNAKKDAKVLRSEIWRFRAASGRAPSRDDIKRIGAEVKATRLQRDYQETFRSALTKLQHYFRWEDGEVVDGDGWLLPLDKMKLRDEDLSLLRRVFASLPPPVFGPTGDDPSSIDLQEAPCPLCGRHDEPEVENATPQKERRNARKKIADEGFMAWVNARLIDEDKPGVWTLVAPLYDDYFKWTTQKRDEQTDGEFAETKAAVMTKTAWGTLMGKMYQSGRDGKKGKRYNVRLKKRKRAA